MPGTVEPEVAIVDEPPALEDPIDDTPPRPYVVFNQNVDIEIDFAQKRVHGRSDILIVPTADVSEVYIDARQCEIDVAQITVSNCEVQATYQDPCEWIQTPKHYEWSAPQWGIRKHRMEPLLHHRRKEVSALDHDLKCCTPLNGSIKVKLPSKDEVLQKNRNSQKSDQQDILLHPDGTIGGYRIRIPFKLRNVNDGFQFVGVDEADTRYPHVYTRHSIEPGTASAIFPCIDDPGSRNSWRISITLPRTLGDVFRQPTPAQQQQSKGSNGVNGIHKRKHNDEELRPKDVPLAEEDKMLDMTVVCSGNLTGEVIHKEDETKKTMTFEVDRNKAAKHIGFAVGPFEHVDLWSEFRTEEDDMKLGVFAVKVHGYCLPGRADEVRNTCCTLATAIDHFCLTFGRYPFESYKVCFIDDMVEDTVPLCAFSLCSNRLLHPEEIVDTEIEIMRTLIYSLASQWFGVNIVPNTKGDIWLVVGIAWFLTDHFMKALCGNNEYRFRMKEMADKIVQLDAKRPSLQDLGEHLHLGSFEVEYMNLKAPVVLFILDRRLSKSSSSTGISKIISRMVSKANTSGQAADEVLGSDAFRRACEKAGGTKLEPFWNQWVTASGCPYFDVHQRFNRKRLCVEMTIRQVQDNVDRTRPLDKYEFWRDVLEENHAVYASELQQAFTGPMTIRIHEADGTPYEHIVEIREENAHHVKFEIPYNTKYKRLKKTRRNRERALARGDTDNHRLLYFLGDVMQQPEEIEEWDFRDWDEETEKAMDLESFEWVRMDADFEWICDMQTNLPAYMYASQLQQDRDVVAQQDTMLFLRRNFVKSGPHPLVSTILTRTVLDTNYYYGIRLLAADELPNHAVKDPVEWIGLRHLLKIFKYFFCQPGTYSPLPNDFSDKRQYFLQRSIPMAVARVRGEDGRCPKEGRVFILEQLQSNDNTDNIYSDQPYICELIKALALSQIPDEKKVKQQKSISFNFGDADEDEVMAEAVDMEPEEFRDMAIEEIERYRRMDEYSPSFQNCFTIAALDAFCRLMKAKVIPNDPIMFIQYLQDRTYDLVRIKACECLVELGMLTNPKFLRFYFILASTDSSPFVRDKLFKALCRGFASMAIGEDEEPEKQAPAESNGDELIVEKDDTVLEERKKAKARKNSLPAALAALKEKTTDDEDLHEALWSAMNSPVLTVSERINVLELCSILVDEDHSLIVNFKYPTYWTVERGEKGRHKCLITFKRHYRTKPRKPYAVQPPPLPVKQEPTRKITLNLNRNMSTSSKAATPLATQAPPLPIVVPTQPKTTETNNTPKPTPKTTLPSLKQMSAPKEKAKEKPKEKPPKERSALPSIKLPVPQEVKEKPILKQAKQSAATNSTSRAGTPSASQEKPKVPKAATPQRDSIAVQPLVRPTIELQQQPESKAGTSKPNGNGLLAPAKSSRPLKRASTDSDGPRPTKIVKLNTSKIPRKDLERVGKKPKSKKLVTLKFKGWDKIHKRKHETSQAASIRATPKHRKYEDKDKSKGRSPRPSVNPGTPTTKHSESAPAASSSNIPRSSSHKAATPTASSQPPPQSSQPISGSSGKPRKPLPDMRKPLPSAAPTSNPTPLAKQHQAPPPASSPTTTAPKAPTKLKIKLKPSAGSSN
ncbi:uncharacterized protein F4822DRAFT_391854 [Hypoxylon trugodes]|uniref:uncharacterized protein n=1 Tax=Hypoxylon trugodes TaxID=326681 RepID=UPI0021949000|nr:uncharacterized protein F4822DRAFT_391854 [Hypoxylon trugodes]KAI1392709.1 hypothetical protein F4822DRAFT_391854 [Hypoxylon trugodes]